MARGFATMPARYICGGTPRPNPVDRRQVRPRWRVSRTRRGGRCLPMSPTVAAADLRRRLAHMRPQENLADPATSATWVRSALDDGLLELPAPGCGSTSERFRGLVEIGRLDPDVARLPEAHVDAQAILVELTGEPADRSLPALVAGPHRRRLWGVWAANPPALPVTAKQSAEGWQLDGTKPGTQRRGVLRC